MRKVHFVHLADLHISTLLSGSWLRRLAKNTSGSPYFDPYSSVDLSVLRALARYLYDRAQSGRPVDSVLVTGDVLDSGCRADAELGHNVLFRRGLRPSTGLPYCNFDPHARPRLTPSFVAAGFPVDILPGNSDRYASPFRRSLGATVFDTRFSHKWSASYRGVQSLPIPNQPLTVVAADLSPKPAGVASAASQGEVDAAILGSMKRQTRAARDHGHAVVWAIHFIPFITSCCPDVLKRATDYPIAKLELLDDSLLVAAAKDVGVHHLFCGHGHFGRVYRPDASVVLHICGSSACSTRLVGPELREVTISLVPDGAGFTTLPDEYENVSQAFDSAVKKFR